MVGDANMWLVVHSILHSIAAGFMYIRGTEGEVSILQ